MTGPDAPDPLTLAAELAARPKPAEERYPYAGGPLAWTHAVPLALVGIGQALTEIHGELVAQRTVREDAAGRTGYEAHGKPGHPDEATGALLRDSLAAMERVGCQFDRCPGPDVEPVDMHTCHVCELIRRLGEHLAAEPAAVPAAQELTVDGIQFDNARSRDRYLAIRALDEEQILYLARSNPYALKRRGDALYLRVADENTNPEWVVARAAGVAFANGWIDHAEHDRLTR